MKKNITVLFLILFMGILLTNSVFALDWLRCSDGYNKWHCPDHCECNPDTNRWEARGQSCTTYGHCGGFVWLGEQCAPGNCGEPEPAPAPPSCSPSNACAASTCTGSTCSNGCGGNVAGTKDCSYCGDGNTNTGETCDDGNTVDGDGCSASCDIEIPIVPEFGMFMGILTLLASAGVFLFARK